jgi:NTP pyrophosphatase (non-canonical NTP hydrolase)
MNELLAQFENMTLALAKDGEDIVKNLTPEQANLWHMATGVSGEAGELLDAIKKHVIYQKPLDVENVKEELGDILFYMSNLMQSVGLSFEEVLQHNVDKLSVRYSSGSYSNKQAQERADKVSEVVEKVILTATENFVSDGGDMRNVLKGDIKSTLEKF